MRKKLTAFILVSLMLFQFAPINDLIAFPISNLNLNSSQTPFIPPDDLEKDFWKTPNIHFSIQYELTEVLMVIQIKNNLTDPITLFNLWIQVNKSDPFEFIVLSNTKIIESQNKLTLSTFDIDDIYDLDGKGQMIFHIKLYEGEVIDVGEEFNIQLNWWDTDEILAQYNPNLIHNPICDDIQVFFQHSIRIEEEQPFPIIERHYHQEIDPEEDTKINQLDFRVTNLMASDLDEFNFTYVKIKDYFFEQYYEFIVESPFLTTSEISDITMEHSETDNEIKYKLKFGDLVILGSNEWLEIKIKWVGLSKQSRIENDFILWSYGDEDSFNTGAPYYLVGLPFYPLLTPAEPIVVLDYDFDGLRNVFELAKGLDPINENSWLVWRSLRSEYTLDPINAKNLKVSGEIMVVVPIEYQGIELMLNLTQLGSDDEIINLKVNEEILYNKINDVGEYIITDSTDRGVYNIEFLLQKGASTINSFYSIDFYLNDIEIPDFSSHFEPDSDGDGLYDKYEKEQYKFIPDADLDGVFDGADLMPYSYLPYGSGETFGLNFPIKDTSTNADIAVNIQIKPTLNDRAQVLDYMGNELRIYPGIRIYGINQQGDYLPDTGFSTDDDETGLAFFNPMKRNGNQETYSWAGTLNYKFNNPAKGDGQILLKFTLVWLIFEHDPISDETNFFHVYDNNDEYIIQGIGITENEPASVVLGIVDDGSNYRKTALYTELAAHKSVSVLSHTPADLANLDIYQATLYDMENLNNTRDNLRNQILTTYGLDYETTSFIYITHGYSLTYNLETLSDAFPDIIQNPLRTYDLAERNNFYLLPDTQFLGLLTKQVLKAEDVEYLDQIKYGFKSDTETKVYDLQFSKFKYVGSSSEEILHFKGDLGDDQIAIHLYDLDVHGTGVSTFDNGGSFEYLTQLKIFQFQLVTPQYPGPGNYWETQLIGCVWAWYVDEYEAFAPTVILTIMDIVNTIGGFIKVIDSLKVFTAFSNVFDKITGPLNIIFGTMRFIFGLSLYFQGAYASGIAEGIRGGLMVAAGVLALFGDPIVCKIAAAAILVVQLVDWLLDEIFGFDMWAAFVSFFWGIEDADPDYDIISNSLVYDEAKIKAQGGFEVGDYIGLTINFENIGNTQLTFGLKIRAGGGSYGSRGGKTISSGSTGSLTATDTFQYASSSFTLTNIVDMSWYYNPPGKWVVNIIPPFLWWVDPPASSGGPYYGDPNSASFNLPVFPNSISQFIGLVQSGAWFPSQIPSVQVETIKDDLTPGVSEDIRYKLKIYPYFLFPKTYVIETPTDGLWDFEFTYDGITYEDTISIDIPWWVWWPLEVDVLITPTSANRLIPGDNNIVIRAQDEEKPLARTNIILDYNVITIIDFDVLFDPFKPDGNELEYDEFIACFINVTNTGNVFDTYNIDVNSIDPDIYFLYTPGAFFVGPLATYSSVIGFQIPYYKIIYPGLIEFTVEISSVTDPSVIKVFDCSIDIKQYRIIHFEVEEADLSMTDSDIYNYEFQLTNLGNINEEIYITYTSVDIADMTLGNNYYPLIPGQTEYFTLTLIPFELGYRDFSITASSLGLYETIDLSINITDDDTQHPYFENFIVKDNENWLNISFIAIDEALGDDLGLSNIDIYVDGALIHSYQPTPSETIFNFSFTNDWIWTEGLHDIRVDITDADDDTITEDSLTTTIYDSFEVTLDEMYKYVIWLCEEMNNYIYDNGITALYGVVTQKLVKIQGLLWDAYQLIEDGYLHTGLVRNKMAEIKLEIAETKTELMINKQSMSQEHFDHLKDCIRNIRNKIVELMGLSMETEFSHDISLVAADIYSLRDFAEDNINATDSENLENAITLAAEKLEDAIFDISLDKDTESALTSAQHALDKAETEVFALQQKGKISVELANSLMIKILILQWQVELLKGEI